MFGRTKRLYANIIVESLDFSCNRISAQEKHIVAVYTRAIKCPSTRDMSKKSQSHHIPPLLGQQRCSGMKTGVEEIRKREEHTELSITNFRTQDRYQRAEERVLLEMYDLEYEVKCLFSKRIGLIMSEKSTNKERKERYDKYSRLCICERKEMKSLSRLISPMMLF
jgi:hypothetical protein